MIDHNALIRRIKNSNITSALAVLSGGTFFAQILSILVTPVVTRLYSPVAIGQFYALISIISIGTVVASLRYDLAIPVIKNKYHANLMIQLCILLSLSSSVLATIAVIVSILIGVIGPFSNIILLISVPLLVFLGSINNVLSLWSVRNGQYKKLAIARILQTSVNSSLQIVLYPFNSLGLLTAQVCSQVASVVTLSISNVNVILFKPYRAKTILLAKKYIKFPQYSSFEALVNTVGLQVPSLGLLLLFGPSAVGFYSIAFRILGIPISLVSASLSQVFLAEGAKAYHQESLPQLTETIIKRLASIAALPAVLIGIISPNIFPLIFGEDWRESGIFVSLMIPWFLLRFILTPISNTFSITNNQDIALKSQLSILILRLSSLAFGAISGSMFITMSLFSLSCCIGLLIQVLLIEQILCLGKYKLIRIVSSEVCMAVICCAPFALCFYYRDNLPVSAMIFSSIPTVLLLSSKYRNVIQH